MIISILTILRASLSARRVEGEGWGGGGLVERGHGVRREGVCGKDGHWIAILFCFRVFEMVRS